MSDVQRVATLNCHHSWVLILPIGGLLLVDLECRLCGVDAYEIWYGGLTHYIDLDLGNGVVIREGAHNSRTELKIPVDVMVRESVRWDSFSGSAVPEKQVRVTPKAEWRFPASVEPLTILDGEFTQDPGSAA